MKYPPIGKAEFVSGNLYIRQMWFAFAGDEIRGHAHNFDHTTYCVRGAIKIETLDLAFKPIAEQVLRAGAPTNWFLIRKQDRHRISALEDDSLAHCIYSHRDANGGVVQEFEGNYEGTM